jgi:hypothetical protein
VPARENASGDQIKIRHLDGIGEIIAEGSMREKPNQPSHDDVCFAIVVDAPSLRSPSTILRLFVSRPALLRQLYDHIPSTSTALAFASSLHTLVPNVSLRTSHRVSSPTARRIANRKTQNDYINLSILDTRSGQDKTGPSMLFSILGVVRRSRMIIKPLSDGDAISSMFTPQDLQSSKYNLGMQQQRPHYSSSSFIKSV